jgi:hypothetical protein
MNKRILLTFSLLMGAFSSNAQKKAVSFQIVPPEEKVANSLYNSIQLMDKTTYRKTLRNSREDDSVIVKTKSWKIGKLMAG